MKSYTSFEEIENDLKLHKLERDIAWEELKLVKGELKEELNPMNWLNSILKFSGKYGFMTLIKRWIFK